MNSKRGFQKITNYFDNGNFFTLFIVITISITLVSYLKLPNLILPTLFSCLTLGLVVHGFIKREFWGFLFSIFFFYSLLTLVIPFILLILFESRETIEFHYRDLNLSSSDLIKSNFVIFIFFFGLRISLLINENLFIKDGSSNKKISKNYFTDFSLNKAYLVLAISIFSKLTLILSGGWYIYNSEFESGLFTNTIRTIEKLDIFIYLLILFKIKSNQISPTHIRIFFLFLSFTFFLAFLSGSKEKIFIQAFIFLMYLTISKNYKLLFSFILIGLISLPSFFEFNYFYRTFNELNVEQAFEIYQFRDENASEERRLLNSEVYRRLDYNKVLALVVQKYPLIPESLNLNYFDNFLGLIPRFIWQSKPQMGVDYNDIGFQLGLLQPSDFVTSLAVSPLGEAYIQFGVFGIPLIIFLTSIMLTFIRNAFKENDLFGYAFLISLALWITPLNSYLVFLPGLLKMLIIFFITKMFIKRIIYFK